MLSLAFALFAAVSGELCVKGEPYDLAFEAPHFIRLTKRVTIGEQPQQLAIALEPRPRLSGVVIAHGTGKPLPDALITTDTTEAVHSDATGRFSREADPERWPTRIVVTAPGFAEQTVRAPRARVSGTLNDIRLMTGATITVEVTGDRREQATTVDLEKHVEGRVEGIPYRQLALQAGSATFAGVEPGPYVVVIIGSEPGQRRSAIVVVKEGEQTRVAIEVKALRLHVATRLGGAPLPDTGVMLRNRDAHWQTKLSTGDTGEASVELWQGGNTSMWVTNKSAMTIPYLDDRLVSDDDDTDWIVDMPNREISGSVVDSATGDPVPDAALVLHVQWDEAGIGVDTKADANGRFRFTPVPYGAHIMKIGARDYAPAEMRYTFSEPEQKRDVMVRLDRASVVHLAIQDNRGQPLANARVMQFRGLRMTGAGPSRDDGSIDIAVPVEESSDVFVVPRDGSFGFAQITQRGPRTIAIPEGTSRIVIRAESESHAPIAGLFAVMRYNGRVVPSDVVRALATQGSRVSSGEDGRIVLEHMPAGAYEFWPVESPLELDSLVTVLNAGTPVRMTVTAGEHTAVLTFARNAGL
jgi:Carboxypeptidase regulatory-like domain